MNKIMIVEDDRKLNDGIVLAQEKIALVLLDVNLPDGNGIDFGARPGHTARCRF